jgi:alcohol dehydrogenase (cytochrome c)
MMFVALGGRARPLLAAAALLLVAACRDGSRTQTASGDTDPSNIDWPGYNGSHDGQRYSTLKQVNTSNVARLRPVCEIRLGEEGPLQTGPVVVGNTMVVTTALTTVAMDAATCAVRWRHVDTSSRQDPIAVNRGVAYMDGRLFRGMPGTRLAAFDMRSGDVLWDVKVGDPSVSEFVSSAPIAWRGKVFVGLAGGDWGIRGRVMGYDAANGQEKWRFYTIPMGSERGAETWHIPSTARRGGGGTWTAYTFDTLSNELFVPIGNPAPDFAPHVRPGANLFTNSVIVLDGESGALKWWYQATPNDGFDYDIGAAPMLYTTRSGDNRMVIGSKDGHVYGVDRRSHQLVFKTPVTTIVNADKQPTKEGTFACPGPLGGVEWNGPALDPETRTIYVGTVDWCSTFKTDTQTHKPGDLYMGTVDVRAPVDSARGWVVALDGEQGGVRWRFAAPAPIVAAVTPTAGGVLFTGDLNGNFYALDKNTGRVLLSTKTGGAIAGGIVTYAVDGRQYVATTSGNVSRSTFQTTGTPRIVVMALETDQRPTRTAQVVTLPPVVARGTPGGRGGQLYAQHCAGCHGSGGEGGAAPSLVESARRDLEAIVAFVKNPNPPMPKLFPNPLTDEDVQLVSEYVRTLQGARQQ